MKSLEERIAFRKEQAREASGAAPSNNITSAEAASRVPSAQAAADAKASPATHAQPQYDKMSADELKGMLIDRGYELTGKETVKDLIHTLVEEDKEAAAAATKSATKS